MAFAAVDDVYPPAGQPRAQFPGPFMVLLDDLSAGHTVVLERSIDGVTWKTAANRGVPYQWSDDTTDRIDNCSRAILWQLRCTEHSGTPFEGIIIGN